MNSGEESAKKSNSQQKTSGVFSFMDTRVDMNNSEITTSLQELIEEHPEPAVASMATMRKALETIRDSCGNRERETKSTGKNEEWSITQDIVVCLPRLATAMRKKFLRAESPLEIKRESYHTLCQISRLLIKEDYEFDEIFHIWRQRMVPIAFEDASSDEYSLAIWALKFLSLVIPDMSYSVLQDEESKKYVEWIANFPKSQQDAERLSIILKRASELEDSNDTLLSRRIANLLSTWRPLSLKVRRFSSDIADSRESVVDKSAFYSETPSKISHEMIKSQKQSETYSEDSQEVFHTPPSSKYRPRDESKLPRSAKKNLDSEDFAWITHNQAEVIEEFASSVRKHAEIVARMSNIGCLDNEVSIEKDFSDLTLKEKQTESEMQANSTDSNKENNNKKMELNKADYNNDLKSLREQVTKKALEEAGIVIEEYQNLLKKYQNEFRAKIQLEHIVQQYEATLRKTISHSHSQMNVRLMTLETEKRKLTAELMAMKEAQQQKISNQNEQIISLEQMNEKDEKIRKQEEMLENLQTEFLKVEKDYHSLQSDAELKLSQAFKQVCLYRDEYLKQSKNLHDLQDEIALCKKLLEERSGEVTKCMKEKQNAVEEKEKLEQIVSEEKKKVENLEEMLNNWKLQYEEKCSVSLQLQGELETLKNWKAQHDNVESELYDTKKQLESLHITWKEINEQNQRLKVRVYDQSQELEHLKSSRGNENLRNDRDATIEKLESQIRAKTKENEQLGALCEELLGKLEALEKRQTQLEFARG
ncbi:hypothetical protein GpartN1_g603.t1 [Galdieria partita]|uniref:Uncharacterized protein n=1 Tax=Galdieria partita TaxID=83374 RepID=A0A9C7UMP4_9RHOD|nr:hypothetical protein GpartN1_g603.t1 [Galdieria partita]